MNEYLSKLNAAFAVADMNLNTNTTLVQPVGRA